VEHVRDTAAVFTVFQNMNVSVSLFVGASVSLSVRVCLCVHLRAIRAYQELANYTSNFHRFSTSMTRSSCGGVAMPLITSGFMDSVMGRSGRREKGKSQEGVSLQQGLTPQRILKVIH